MEELATAEALVAARNAVPMLLLALLLLKYVIGGAAMSTAPMKSAFALQLIAIVLRWATLLAVGPRKANTMKPHAWHRLVGTATAWATSAGIANIFFAARAASTIQILELTLISTAICAIAVRSMAPHPWRYAGYVAIQLTTLLIIIFRAADQSLVPVVPVMFGIFLVALGATSLRGNADLRERIRLTLELRESSLRDSLTGLRNRRFAVAFAQQRAAQVTAAAVPGRRESFAVSKLAFLMIDLDHFKSVNDRYGHSAGDVVLATFAEVATKTFRAHDIVARWGGEEFLVILEVGCLDDAKVAADRLRSTLERTRIEVAKATTISVTCSIGIATLSGSKESDSASSWQETINVADARLYLAKAAGRNRIRWADTPGSGNIVLRAATPLTQSLPPC